MKISSLIDDTIANLTNKMQSDYENCITHTVEQTLGCEVNKEELIKAMRYDRNQYDKGYFDGYSDGIEEGKRQIWEQIDKFKLSEEIINKCRIDRKE
jgi:hypothetical protein